MGNAMRRTPTASKTALATAGADVGINSDVIAGRRDRAGGTEIETTIAADALRARMRSNVRSESDVARLVEAADEVTRFQHCLEQCRRIIRIRAIGEYGDYRFTLAHKKLGDAARAASDVAATRREYRAAACGYASTWGAIPMKFANISASSVRG